MANIEKTKDDAQAIREVLQTGRSKVMKKLRSGHFDDDKVATVKKILERCGKTDRCLIALYLAEVTYHLPVLTAEEIYYFLTETQFATNFPSVGAVEKSFAKARDLILPECEGRICEYRLTVRGHTHVEKIFKSHGQHHHKFFHKETY